MILTSFRITLLALTMLFAIAQQQPCQSEQARQFDFWLGNWDASWEGGSGSNSVSKILGSCVVYEQFEANDEKPLIGKSVSVYDPRANVWRQTWVDNSGGYLDFEGGWQSDRMVLSRSFERNGKTIMQRMVWYNIKQDAFDWNWEKSEDGGESWTVNWQIHYTRRK